MANKYRELLAQVIENNGGYSAGRGGTFALEFTVGLYYADLSVEHLYKIAVENFGPLPPLTPAIEWDVAQAWEWAQQNMTDTLNDNEGYCTYSPSNAKLYGMPYCTPPGLKYWRRKKEGDVCGYPAKVSGWWIVNPYCNESYSVKFGLYGRGGKHLCIESFEGVRLDMSADQLADAIRNDEDGTYSNKWCQRLLCMVVEWEKCFTSKLASAELEYQCADQLAQRLLERGAAWRKALANARAEKKAHAIEKEERSYWASRDIVAIG